MRNEGKGERFRRCCLCTELDAQPYPQPVMLMKRRQGPRNTTRKPTVLSAPDPEPGLQRVAATAPFQAGADAADPGPLQHAWDTIKSALKELLDLAPTTARIQTVQSVADGVTMRGPGSWMLVCSTLLASIGLDTNSPAVIIGAMLVSPLMSPILGVGLSLGIQDRGLFGRSARNLGFAIAASLVISTLYFWVSPLGEVNSEILARTRPTILDVGVAVFGGIAGIVSMSRSFASTALPGVAIATALMPPLCTAGFGIATRRADVFSGAIYLFLINAIFISLATYLTVRYMRFPLVSYIDKTARRKRLLWIIAVIVVSVVPSLYFLHSIYREIGLRRVIQRELLPALEKQKLEILEWKVISATAPLSMRIMYAGGTVSDKEVQEYSERMNRAGYPVQLRFYKTNVTREDLEKMTSRERDISIDASGALSVSENRMREIENSIRVFFPELEAVAVGNVHFPVEGGGTRSIPVLVLDRGPSAIAPARKQEIESKALEYMNAIAGSASYEVLWNR